MIKMKWQHAKGGDSYNKYLYDDLLEGVDLRGSSNYLSSSPEFEHAQLYSSIEGELAHELGISGPATREALHLIDGLIEQRAGKPSKDANGVLKRVVRSSIEVNSSFDKTFSYAYNLLETQEEKDRFIDCLKEVNKSTLDAMFDKHIHDLNNKPGKFIRSTFVHIENRDGLPQIHFHNNYYNYIVCEDGKVRSIEMPEIRDTSLKTAMDFVLKTEAIKSLMREFPNLRFEAYNTKGEKLKDDKDTIKDFRVAFNQQSLEVIAQQSSLADRIDKEVERRVLEYKAANTLETKDYGKNLRYLHSAKYREQVHKEIKPKKQAKSQNSQSSELAAHAASLKLRYKNQYDVGALTTESGSETLSQRTRLLVSLTQTQDGFTENDLVAHIAKNCCGGLSSIAAAKQILANEQQVIFDERTKRYVPRSLCALEVQNVAASDRLSVAPVAPIAFDNRALVGANLEQAALVKNALGDRQLHIGVGLPGTGKSFTARKVVDAARASNYRTIGIAPTGKVSSALKADTGCDEAFTLDKLLLELTAGKLTLDKNTYLVLDEAGMVGCRNWHKLLKTVEASGARLLAIGDPEQLESVSAGDTLRQLLQGKAGKQASTLTKIIRQKDENALAQANLVSMSNVKYEDKSNLKDTGAVVDQVFKHFEQSNNIKSFDSEEAKTAHIVSQYMKSSEEDKDKIILCSLNKSVEELNAQIVQQRLEAGLLSGEPVCGFYINDRVILKKNAKEYKNGDIGTVLAIDKERNATILFDSTKVRTINLDEVSEISHAYAMTVHKSQGITVNKTFFNLEASQINSQNLLNVGITRGRQITETFIVDSQRSAVIASFKQRSKKTDLVALHALSQKAPTPQIMAVQPTIAPSKPTTDLSEAIEQEKQNRLLQEKQREIERQAKLEHARREAEIVAFNEQYAKVKKGLAQHFHDSKTDPIEAQDTFATLKNHAFEGLGEHSMKGLRRFQDNCAIFIDTKQKENEAILQREAQLKAQATAQQKTARQKPAYTMSL